MSAKQGESEGQFHGVEAITEEWAAAVLPRRQVGAHKWAVGGVIVVAGSPLYAGAAALCCAAAGRSGAGIVSAAVPRSIAPTVVGLSPEVTLVVLPEGDSLSGAHRGAEAIAERLERSKSIIVGPGLGTDEAAHSLLNALFGVSRTRTGIGFESGRGLQHGSDRSGVIAAAAKPVVVDADALNWLAEQESWWEKVPAELLVLTPHPGEMARLIDQDVQTILDEPVQVARDAARRWNQTVVLKGGRTVVATSNGAIRGMQAPPALATAGSGDVLSGSLGAFLAQGLSPGDAAALAVFVGCRAAQEASTELGTLGVVAGDFPLAIARVLRDLEVRGE